MSRVGEKNVTFFKFRFVLKTLTLPQVDQFLLFHHLLYEDSACVKIKCCKHLFNNTYSLSH